MNRVTRLCAQIAPSTSSSHTSSYSPATCSSSSSSSSLFSACDAKDWKPPKDYSKYQPVKQQDGYDILKTMKHGSMKGKTLFVSGASRGIGLAIALRCAKDGANICIAAKTVVDNPKLPGTIYTAAEECRKAGGQALAVECDIRSEESVKKAVDLCVKTFGGIDVCINNASAIRLTNTEETPMKAFDLMHSVNARGTFLCSKYCIPHLKKSSNAHIMNISPPLLMEENWFAPHVAYTMAKYGMSLCVLGMAGELRDAGISVNALWPLTTIATSAVQNLLGGDDMVNKSRLPSIMADSAYVVLTADAKKFTGQFFIDEYVLRAKGKDNFAEYAVVPGTPDSELAPDFFV